MGLTLAAAAAAGFPVVGIDVDAARIEGLAAGDLVVPGVPESSARGARAAPDVLDIAPPRAEADSC